MYISRLTPTRICSSLQSHSYDLPLKEVKIILSPNGEVVRSAKAGSTKQQICPLSCCYTLGRQEVGISIGSFDEMSSVRIIGDVCHYPLQWERARVRVGSKNAAKYLTLTKNFKQNKFCKILSSPVGEENCHGGWLW